MFWHEFVPALRNSHPVELTLMGWSWVMAQSILDETMRIGLSSKTDPQKAMADFLYESFFVKKDDRLLWTPLGIHNPQERN